MIKKTKSNPADDTTNPADMTQQGEPAPTYRENAAINAKIDEYIQKNPEYVKFLQGMPRERMERAMVLNKVQQQERKERFDSGVMRKIDGDPELKQSLDALVKNLPEDQKQSALVKMGNHLLRDIGFFKSRGQGGVKV